MLWNNVEMIETEELRKIIIYCPEEGTITDIEGNNLLRTDGKGGYVIYLKGNRYPAHNIAYQYSTGEYPKTRGYITFTDLDRANIKLDNLHSKDHHPTLAYLQHRFIVVNKILYKLDGKEITSAKVSIDGKYYKKTEITHALSGERPLRSDNMSGYPGVCWSTASKKWQVNHKSKYLGVFDTIEQAIAAKKKEESK